MGQSKRIINHLILLPKWKPYLLILAMIGVNSGQGIRESQTSSERQKRQLFRDEIPRHRPLSGNLYALHHGYPHPGRWHANQQGILPPNYSSGLHFDNPNVILTDDDFNRYGSTLQHIDNHRIVTNPQPILHEYPVQLGKVVTIEEGVKVGGFKASLPYEEDPVLTTHQYFHNGQDDGGDIHQHHVTDGHVGTDITEDIGGGGQTFSHIEHGHTVIHDGGHKYPTHPPMKFSTLGLPPVVVTKSKPFFGLKLPSLFASKGLHMLKGFWPGRYGIAAAAAIAGASVSDSDQYHHYKSKSNGPGIPPISWTSIEHHHRR